VQQEEEAAVPETNLFVDLDEETLPMWARRRDGSSRCVRAALVLLSADSDTEVLARLGTAGVASHRPAELPLPDTKAYLVKRATALFAPGPAVAEAVVAEGAAEGEASTAAAASKESEGAELAALQESPPLQGRSFDEAAEAVPESSAEE